MIVKGSVDSRCSKTLFLSARVMMIRKSAFSAREPEKPPAIILSDFIEAAPHFDPIP